MFANAGIAELPWIPILETSPEASLTKPDFTTLNIDLNGQLNTAALALQLFLRQEEGAYGFKGKLIFTSSVFGIYPSHMMPMYCAAKTGVVAFARSQAQFYADKKITINVGACEADFRINV